MPLQNTPTTNSTPAQRRFTSSSHSAVTRNSPASASSARFLHPSQRQNQSLNLSQSGTQSRTPFAATQRSRARVRDEIDVDDDDDDDDDDGHDQHNRENDSILPANDEGNLNRPIRNDGETLHQVSSDTNDNDLSVGVQPTSATKRRKISLRSNKAANKDGKSNDDRCSSPAESSSPSSTSEDQVSDISDDDPMTANISVSPSKPTSSFTPTRSAAAAAGASYPTIQSRLLNPPSTSTFASPSTPLRRPPTTPSKRQDTTPPNVLPDIFSPSRRRGQKEYLPAGAAEHVRSWILDILARTSQVGTSTSTPTSRTASSSSSNTTITNPTVLCRDAGGRFALITESLNSNTPDSHTHRSTETNASHLNPSTQFEPEPEPEPEPETGEIQKHHLLINTDLYQANTKQTNLLARRKIEKLGNSNSSVKLDVQPYTKQTLNWALRMDSSLVGILPHSERDCAISDSAVTANANINNNINTDIDIGTNDDGDDNGDTDTEMNVDADLNPVADLQHNPHTSEPNVGPVRDRTRGRDEYTAPEKSESESQSHLRSPRSSSKATPAKTEVSSAPASREVKVQVHVHVNWTVA